MNYSPPLISPQQSEGIWRSLGEFDEIRTVSRRRTNVQQLTCKIDLPFSFYYLFFSFVLLELKPFVLKGKVLGEKVPKSVKIMKRCCPLVVAFRGIQCNSVGFRENNSDHPHPPYLQNMPPKYAIQWGFIWHKSRLESRDFYRKYGIQTPLLWHTNPPFYAIWTVFYWGWGWSLICWFRMVLNMNSVGTPGGFGDNAGFSGKIWDGVVSGDLGSQEASAQIASPVKLTNFWDVSFLLANIVTPPIAL